MTKYAQLINGLADIGFKQPSESIDYYLEAIKSGKKDFIDALAEMIEKEKTFLQERAEKACVKVANFPFLKTLKDYDFTFQPAINKEEIQELSTLSFIDKFENIIFVGTCGVGKTHLATSIGIECASNRYSTYFVTFDKLISQLKQALYENNLGKRMKFYSKYKILIIDELGYTPIDEDAANVFFQLISNRYERNPTIITTNMPFSKWGDIFKSSTLANAILDRLLHHSRIITINGPSYRLKEKCAVLEDTAH